MSRCGSRAEPVAVTPSAGGPPDDQLPGGPLPGGPDRDRARPGNREGWDHLRTTAARARLRELHHEGGTWPGFRRRVVALKDDGTPIDPKPHPLLVIVGLAIAAIAILMFGWQVIEALLSALLVQGTD